MNGRFNHRKDWTRGTKAPAKPIVLSEWIRYVELAQGFARAALDEALDHIGDAEQLMRFNAWLRDAAAEAFPPASPIVRLQAAAWLNAARAFAHPDASPETRTACAPLMAEASRLMDRAITLHRTAAADSWRGQSGERD